MLVKKLLLSFVVLGYAFQLNALDKQYQELLKQHLEQATQSFSFQYSITPNKQALPQIAINKTEIDAFLRSEFGASYSGFHDDILSYVQFFSSRPEQQLKSWFTLDKLFYNKLDNNSQRTNIIWSITRSRLEYSSWFKPENCLLPYPISLVHGNKHSEFSDDRWNTLAHFEMRKSYFESLISNAFSEQHALAVNVLGASTITRIENYAQKSFWELYPDIQHEQRDFYAAMCAVAYIFDQWQKNALVPFTFEDLNHRVALQTNYVQHLEVLAAQLGQKKLLNLWNMRYFKGIIPKHGIIELPASLKLSFLENQEDLALQSALLIHDIKKPFTLVCRKLTQNDAIYPDTLLKYYGNTWQTITHINFLEEEVFKADRVLFFKVPLKDSTYYAGLNAFDHKRMHDAKTEFDKSQADWPELCAPPSQAQKKYHTVKTGDTLGSLARKYGTSVSTLKKWNKLSSDRINIGQKLIVKDGQ